MPPTVIHHPTSWKVNHAPAANTKATATQAAPPDGYFNVVTALTVIMTGGASAPSATSINVAVIDGASGGTTYLWGPNAISIPAVAGAMNGIALSGLSIPATAKTQTTIEFSAAGGANTVQSVWMEGRVSSDF